MSRFTDFFQEPAPVVESAPVVEPAPVVEAVSVVEPAPVVEAVPAPKKPLPKKKFTMD
jgi:hypothetical protein